MAPALQKGSSTAGEPRAPEHHPLHGDPLHTKLREDGEGRGSISSFIYLKWLLGINTAARGSQSIPRRVLVGLSLLRGSGGEQGEDFQELFV